MNHLIFQDLYHRGKIIEFFIERFIQILLQMELLKSMLNITMYMMKIIHCLIHIVFIIIKDNLKKLNYNMIDHQKLLMINLKFKRF